jgi:hypothetical protein
MYAHIVRDDVSTIFFPHCSCRQQINLLRLSVICIYDCRNIMINSAGTECGGGLRGHRYRHYYKGIVWKSVNLKKKKSQHEIFPSLSSPILCIGSHNARSSIWELRFSVAIPSKEILIYIIYVYIYIMCVHDITHVLWEYFP